MSDVVTASAIFSFSIVTWAYLTHDFISGTKGFISAISAGGIALGLYRMYLSYKTNEVKK